MLNDPRDPVAYRIGIAGLVLIVATVFVGISWVAVSNDEQAVPGELWFAAGGFAGVFVGALIPFSVYASPSRSGASEGASCRWAPGAIVGALLLVAICVTAVVLGLVRDSWIWDGLGVTIAGVLLGLPIPSPGQRGP